jgi:Flp pilus assembly protein TadG
MLTVRTSAKAESASTQRPNRRRATPGRTARGLRDWRRSDSGATAVEFAFVLPVLLMIMAGIIQFGAVFFLQNNMANAAREAARALAVGSIETKAESKQLVDQKLVNWGVTFNVDTNLPDPGNAADTDFTVTITAPLSEAAIFDYLGVFEGGTLRASASMREES